MKAVLQRQSLNPTSSSKYQSKRANFQQWTNQVQLEQHASQLFCYQPQNTNQLSSQIAAMKTSVSSNSNSSAGFLFLISASKLESLINPSTCWRLLATKLIIFVELLAEQLTPNVMHLLHLMAHLNNDFLASLYIFLFMIITLTIF